MAACPLPRALKSVSSVLPLLSLQNPSGRIINRFLADQATVDDTVKTSVTNMVDLVFSFIAGVAVVAATTPLVLILVALLAAAYWFIARGYRFAARDLRRMQSVAKSPVISNYAEVIRGLATLRAWGPDAAHAFLTRHLHLSRDYARAYMSYWSSNEFVSTWGESA